MKPNTIFDNISLFMLGGLFAVLPLISNQFNEQDGTIPIFFISILYSILIIYGICFNGSKYFHGKITVIDVCFSLYLGYGIFRIGISKELFEPIMLCEWFGLVTIYILIRLLARRSLYKLYVFLLIGGTIQAFVGLSQLAGLIESDNLNFSVTGSFFNPAHWGGYLALSVVICFSLWRKSKFYQTKKNIFFSCIFLIQTVGLIFSDSRASWLAVSVSLVFLFIDKNTFSRIFFRGWYIKIISVILIILFLSILYFYKKQSADVRLLTWKSSLLMIQDKPVLGHGVGCFAANYMHYQARFLDKTPSRYDALIADNNIIAFNEYIHLACEQGITGLSIFIILLIFSFTGKPKSQHVHLARSGLLCLCILALFSYPASILPIKIYFPLFIGIIGKFCRPLFDIASDRNRNILFAGVITLCLVFNIYTCKLYDDAYRSLEKGRFLNEESKDYSNMKHNKNFLYLLSEQYLRHDQIEKSLQTKVLLLNIAPTSSLLCDIGMIYLHKNELDSANSCFLLAERMTPNHMEPHHGQLLVAKKREDRELCMKLSKKIISIPVRVVNNVVLRAKKEARDYIQEQSINQ